MVPPAGMAVNRATSLIADPNERRSLPHGGILQVEYPDVVEKWVGGKLAVFFLSLS